MNLRKKLFVAFLLLIIIPLFVLGGVTYIISTHVLQKKYSQQAELTLNVMSHSIRYVLDDMNHVSDSWIGNYYLQSILTPSQTTEHQDSDPLKLVTDERNFRRVMVNHPSIDFALMFDFSGNRIQLMQKYDGLSLDFEHLRENPLYPEIIKRDGSPLWLGPYEHPELTGGNPVLTQIRLVKDIYTLENRGILLLQIKLSDIERFFREALYTQTQQGQRFVLVNREGMVLFDNKHELGGRNLADSLSDKELPVGDYVSRNEAFEGEDSIVSMYSLEGYDWKLISIMPWSSLSQEMVYISKWMFGISFFCLVSALMFNLLFVNQVARSIVMTVRSMRRLEQGELRVRMKEYRVNDETLWLAQGFNSMAARIGTLIEDVKEEQERKKRAEMSLMQAQIKPHFLFNTLESINVLAVRGDGRKVSQMVQRLGKVLRLSFQGKEEVTLREELDHVRNYLDIQKFRFEDLFDYVIDVPEDLLDCGILKLTLQPLVENAIQHGIDGLERKMFIFLRGMREGGRLILSIEDNGVGIPLQVQAGLLDDRIMSDSLVSLPIQERHGLGLRNVADRLRIHYGSSYGLWVCSLEGEGTTIRCVVPDSSPRAD